MQTELVLLDSLKRAGHRLTSGRRAVVRGLLEAGGPVTASELHERLARRGEGPNKTTVYRELAFLTEAGVTRELLLGERTRRYELKPDAHTHHLVCTGCRRIEDVVLENDLDEVERRLKRETAFEVRSHSLEFYGLCADCRS